MGRRDRTLLSEVERRRVLIPLKSGAALRGVLWASGDGLLVLKAAEYLEENHDPVPVDGEAIVETANVEFVQVLPVDNRPLSSSLPPLPPPPAAGIRAW
jgi:hypothetical protein